MSKDDIAISVQGISKSFKLPHEKLSSIKGLFVTMFHGKRTYERQQVLNNISFEIKKGEFFGIVGRNGSGKSTLLKMLAGIYTPEKGHIQINGKLTPFIELGVGFNPELTGRENVFLNGALLGFNREEIAAMYDEIVEFAELARFMDQKLKNYSSGMQVRLAFSIAIRANTEILVLDEVLAVGDANFQKKCFEYFRQLKRDKKTVILVSHDMDSVRKFSDRALLLEKSEVVMIGNPHKVSEEYMRRNNIEAAKSAKKKEKSGQQKSTKIAEITKVALLNAQSKPTTVLSDSEAAKIRIEFKVSDLPPVFNIGVGLYSESYGYVFGYNTQMDAQKVDPSRGTLTLSLDSLPLLGGAYYINIVCFGDDEADSFDFMQRAAVFEVRNTGSGALYRGIVCLDHKWRV